MAEQWIYDEAWIASLARRACLELSPEERNFLARELGEALDDLRVLSAIDCSVPWEAFATGLSALREDASGVCLPEGWASSPMVDDCIVVSRVLEDGGN